MIKPIQDAEPLQAEVIELFRNRAARLHQSETAGEDVDLVWLAEFPVGEESFAFRVEALLAALPLRLVTPVPLAPPEVVGVFRHQGETLAVYSLASLLGVRGWRQDPSVLLVLELPQGGRVAVDCEQIPKPVSLPSAVFAAADSRPGAITTVVANDRPLSVLSIEKLFPARSA